MTGTVVGNVGGSQFATELLVDALRGRDESIRPVTAMRALAGRRWDGRLEDLTVAVLDGRLGIRGRRLAALELGRTGAAANDAIRELVDHDLPDHVRGGVLRALGIAGDAEALGILDRLDRLDGRLEVEATWAAWHLAHRHRSELGERARRVTRHPRPRARLPDGARPEPMTLREASGRVEGALRRRSPLLPDTRLDVGSLTELSCAGRTLAVVLTDDAARSPRSLAERPGIAAVVLARDTTETGDWFERWLVHTRPDEAGITVTVTVAGTTAVRFAGTARTDGEAIEVRLGSIPDHGTTGLAGTFRAQPGAPVEGEAATARLVGGTRLVGTPSEGEPF